MTTPMEKKTRTVKALAAPQRDAVLAALPGTIKQISERTGISIDAVWHHIYHLADKWLVERDGRVPAPAPGAPFRTCLMFCRAGERKTTDKPKVASAPRAPRAAGNAKMPPPTPKPAPKVWVIDSPFRTNWVIPHPYGPRTESESAQ